MPKKMIVLLVDTDPIPTRVVLGCTDIAHSVALILCSYGYCVASTEGPEPKRDPSELERAQKLLKLAMEGATS